MEKLRCGKKLNSKNARKKENYMYIQEKIRNHMLEKIDVTMSPKFKNKSGKKM